MPHENSIYIQFSNGLLLYVLSFQRSISPTQERTCKYIFIYCLCKTKVGNSLSKYNINSPSADADALWAQEVWVQCMRPLCVKVDWWLKVFSTKIY